MIWVAVVLLVVLGFLFNWGAGEGGKLYDEASERYAQQTREGQR